MMPGLRGFTIVELIVVIAITAIVAGMVAVFIVRPVEGYTDLARRAQLVDAAESALRRMARDIRLAVPNSVRVTATGGGFVLELLPVVDGGRYATAEADVCQNLTGFEPAAADVEFDILGTFPTLTPTSDLTGHRLVINNQGDGTTHDVYADAVAGAAPRVITPPATTFTIATGTCGGNGKHHILLSAAHQFRSDSPRDRVFVVTTPVTYLCNPALGTLVRYQGYSIAALHADRDTDAELIAAGAANPSPRVADKITACSATSTTDQVRDRGLVTLTLTLTDSNDRISLTHQVQVDNSR